MRELAGRTAMVTGAGSGIGRGIALALAKAGMHVVIADIEADAAHAVGAEIGRMGGSAESVALDVVDADAVEGLADRLFRERDGVHLLCNNAGVSNFGLMCSDFSLSDWEWVLAVNLRGVIHGLQAFLPRMIQLEGQKHVVNTSSTAGIEGAVFVAPYVAAKHGVVGLTDTLRREGAAHQLGASVLCPSAVRTRIVDSERNRHGDFGGPKSGASNEMVAAHIAQGGLDPLWVGALVVHAVQEDVPYIFTHLATRNSVVARYESMCRSFEWTSRFIAEHGDGQPED